jgi:parvulin-like peptidyl-prolyl isomerase
LKKSSATLLTTLCLVSLLAGCTKPEKTSTSTTKTDTEAGTAVKTSTDSTTATTDAAEKKDDTTVAADAGSTATTPADSSAVSKTAATTAAPGSAAVNAPKVAVNLNKLDGKLVICTVAGDPITVNEYRNMLTMQQIQMQANSAVDAGLRMSLLQQAKKAGMTLSPDEKARLLTAAKAQEKNLAQALKANHITEKQFEDQIYDAGLVMKAINTVVEQGILSQLVSRELLVKASRSAGLEKTATSAVAAVKKTPNFENLRKQTGMTADALNAELVKGELAKLQIAKLQKKIAISPGEVRNFYDQNKKQLAHGERIRLATILVACPEKDKPGVQSVRTQVQKAFPKLQGKDLDQAVTQATINQQNKALILLGEAQGSGANFAKIANEKSDDMNARVHKTGGDMGWQAKENLQPALVESVWKMKSGSVLPKLVKTDDGFMIIKVTAHEPAGTLALKDVEPLIKNKLAQDKLSSTVNSWIADQQKTYRIEFTPSFISAAQGKSQTAQANAPQAH